METWKQDLWIASPKRYCMSYDSVVTKNDFGIVLYKIIS